MSFYITYLGVKLKLHFLDNNNAGYIMSRFAY